MHICFVKAQYWPNDYSLSGLAIFRTPHPHLYIKAMIYLSHGVLNDVINSI